MTTISERRPVLQRLAVRRELDALADARAFALTELARLKGLLGTPLDANVIVEDISHLAVLAGVDDTTTPPTVVLDRGYVLRCWRAGRLWDGVLASTKHEAAHLLAGPDGTDHGPAFAEAARRVSVACGIPACGEHPASGAGWPHHHLGLGDLLTIGAR